jgi:hypothetical protein
MALDLHGSHAAGFVVTHPEFGRFDRSAQSYWGRLLIVPADTLLRGGVH